MKNRPSIANCSKEGLKDLTDCLSTGDRMRMRGDLIFAAGALNNKKLLEELGSAERAHWFEGRRAADPEFANPYWPDR